MFADKLMQSGFRLATRAGFSFATDDMLACRKEKHGIIANAEAQERDPAAVRLGSRHPGERYNKVVVDIWGAAGDEIARAMMTQLGLQMVTDREGKQVRQIRSPIFMMADRAPAVQLRRLPAGGHARPDGEAGRLDIETPITANFREGLNRVLQYFI